MFSQYMRTWGRIDKTVIKTKNKIVLMINYGKFVRKFIGKFDSQTVFKFSNNFLEESFFIRIMSIY